MSSLEGNDPTSASDAVQDGSAAPAPPAAEPTVTESDLYFIETYLRQRGDYMALLEIDALVLRDDLEASAREALLQQTIQGAMNVKRQN